MRNIPNSFIALLLVSILASCNSGIKKEEQKMNNTNQQTAFEDPPQWAQEAIWYQIFPERFRNGDSTNDPTPVDMEGCYPGYIPDSWKLTPWTQDWYKEDAYFADLKGHTDFSGNPINDFGQKAQLRRYGGDLQGVLDQLDYLDSLGITAIYFNPLNDAPSLHKYDARHWRHIDRNFGPNPKKDIETMAAETADDPSTWQFTEADKMFLDVLEACHQRGIKVILDYSWNHTGHTFWAWNDLVKNQKDSKYADWYWVDSFDDPETDSNEFAYKGWFGVVDLPEIRETEYIDHSNGIKPAEGNIYSEAAKQHIFNVTKRWLDPNGDGDPADGVDGYRLDVAAEIPFGFWREYRKVVRDINPDAYLLGEVWWERWPDQLLDPEPFLKGDIFDAPMNYRWYRAARHFFNASPDAISVSEFTDQLNALMANIRKQNNYAMMNLTASHDAPRVSTSLFNRDKYKYNAKPAADTAYKINKPDEKTLQTLRLLLAHQFTYIGAPHIWAGDEMGMWGADDPSTRKPLIWPDYNFEDETTHPLGLERPRDKVEFNSELFHYYQKLIQIRKDNPVLAKGDIKFLKIDDDNNVLAYSRFDKHEQIFAVFNNSLKNRKIELPFEGKPTYSDVLSGIPIKKLKDKLELLLPPRTAAILVQDQ